MNSLTSVAVLIAATLGGEPDGVILDFSATWCPPCQQMVPIVNRLRKQGYPIQKIDFDQQRALAHRYGVEKLPTFVLVVRGKEQQRYVGAMSESQLRRMAQLIPAKRPEPVVRPASAVTVESPAEFDHETIIRANNSEPPRTGEVSKDPMAVCVRIRVRDSKGVDIGSGSVIHSEPGRTLILTCGHIFRHFDGKSTINVDNFNDGRAVSHKGQLIRKDLESDIGLISIQTLTPLRVARVSPDPIRQGQHVFSVGCGGGEPPSRLQHRVTSTDRYKGGYIECTGTPIQGRSGGGLFTPDGQVVGVCVFANPGSRRGLYTGLKTIHGLLDRVGLTSLYEDGPAANPIKLVGAEEPAESDEPEFEDAAENPAPSSETRQPVKQLELEPVKTSAASLMPEDFRARDSTPRPLSNSVRHTLRDARGNEVVCIIRRRDNPNTPSRVVIIHEASEQFVAELTGELHSQVRPASIEVRRPKPVEEFSVPTPSTKAFFGGSTPHVSFKPPPLPQQIEPQPNEVRRYRRSR
jgi:thiol-disulfide isomerase/thioredoxin